jgi:hypothetical protein
MKHFRHGGVASLCDLYATILSKSEFNEEVEPPHVHAKAL